MPSDKIINLNDDIFDTVLIKSKIPVIVHFCAQKSGPCRTLTPILESLADEYEGLIQIGVVNVEECPKTVRDFRITNVPTLAIAVDGITEQRVIGLKPIDELRKVINKYVRRNICGESDR